MDLLRNAAQWLERQRAEYAAHEVTYQRAAASTALRATCGRREYTVDDGNGFPVSSESWDWLITAADLEIDGELTQPAVGDRIIDGEPESANVYEVMALPGTQHWQWSDSFGMTYRVHTKKVGTQPPQP